ncbi:MAG: MaoC family dehydratase N-terminal domain-containing protein [bacterium]
MADNLVITEEMKSMLGWESEPWMFEVTRTSVRAFARGVGYSDRTYFDVETARKAGYPDLPAPPTYLGTPVFIPGESDDTFSSPPGFNPDLKHGLKGLLDGGTDTEYQDTICAGDTLSCVRKLTNLEAKNSKSLGDFLIVTSEFTFTNQNNVIVAVQTTRGIFY